MIIEHAVKTHLEAQAGFTALVSGLYYVTAPQDVVEPYVVMTKISSAREQAFSGPSSFAVSRFQFTVVADTYREAKLIQAQIRSALQGIEGLKGDSPGVRIYSSTFDNETDMYEDCFQLTLDFVITHEEV